MTENELAWMDINTRLDLLPKYMKYWVNARLEVVNGKCYWRNPKTFQEWIDYNVDVLHNRKSLKESGMDQFYQAFVDVAEEMGFRYEINVVKKIGGSNANLEFL